MNKQELLAQHLKMSKIIQDTIKASKEAGCTVQINQNIPCVAVNLGADSEYFFQGQEASELLIQADFIASTYGLWASDAILWLSQGW